MYFLRNDNSAKVVCRMIGFSHGIDKMEFSSEFGSVWSPYSMGNLKCHGSEDSVFDCPHGDVCRKKKFSFSSTVESFGVKCFPIDQNCFSLSFKDKIICSNENDYVNSQVICQWSGFSTGIYLLIYTKLIKSIFIFRLTRLLQAWGSKQAHKVKFNQKTSKISQLEMYWRWKKSGWVWTRNHHKLWQWPLCWNVLFGINMAFNI